MGHIRARRRIAKPLRSLDFEGRRVAIDQGHKLAANVKRTVAEGEGAIAARWKSHGAHDASYDARPEHKAMDGDVMLIRGSWAQNAGLVKPGPEGYTDDHEQPAELPFCRCQYEYIFTLRKLPEELLTAKGKEALSSARTG